MKKRKILVLIPMVGLFLSGCSFSEGFAKAKHWVADNIYHPAKDWIDEKTGKKEEKKDDEKPTPEPAPAGDVAVTGVTVTPAALNLTTESADQTLTATVAPSNATNKSVTWSVAPEGVVSVSEAGVVHVVAVGDAVVTATSVADTTKKATCTVKVTEPGTPTGGDGSETNPYSVLEVLEVYKDLQDKEWSETRVYVKGEITGYAASNNTYTMQVDDEHKLVVFKPTLALPEGTARPCVGDVAIAEGFVENYSGTWELTGNANDSVEAHKVYPSFTSIVSRGTSAVTLDSTSSEYATVTYEASGTNGSQYSFTVAVASGYVINAVSVNGGSLEGEDGVYSFLLLEPSTIKVTTAEEGGPVVKTIKKTVSALATENGWTIVSGSGDHSEHAVSPFNLDSVVTVTITGTGNTATVWSNGIRCYTNNADTPIVVTFSASTGYSLTAVTLTFTTSNMDGTSFALTSDTADEFEATSSKSYTLAKGSKNPQLIISAFEVTYVQD